MGLFSRFIADQRHQIVAPYIEGDVLDLGCGNALILENYRTRITSYYGVERSVSRVEKLRKSFPDACFVQRDLDRDLLGINKEFDCVLMIALIEHLFNQRFVMEEVLQVLKPGGKVIITAPTPLGNDLVHRVGAALGLFAKSAVDDHIVLYNHHRFKILANEIGFVLSHHKYFQLCCNQLAILEKPSVQ
jgi:SAM-dependent methyltransferase